MAPDQIRPQAWRSLREHALAPHTYVVARLAGRAWAVFPLDAGDVIHEGGNFMSAWSHAVQVARTQAPALIVALNDKGEVVAKETVQPQVRHMP